MRFSALVGAFFLGFLSVSGTLTATDQRYDYDELGRLIRAVSDDGTVTRYGYDPVGNILSVRVDAGQLTVPPNDISLSSLRCGEPVEVSLHGDDLRGTQVTSSTPGVQISNLHYTDTGLSFTLLADCDALGQMSLTFTSAAGSSTVTLQVAPLLPSVFVTPAPLAVPPDGSVRSFLLRLSHADTETHNFQLESSNPDKLKLISENLSISAGSTEVLGRVAGMAPGQAFLDIVSPTLGSTRVPVFVAVDFAGVNSSYALPLGVVLQRDAPPTEVPSVLAAPVIGVFSGEVITGVEPRVLNVGTGPTPVVITGRGLNQAVAVKVMPGDGVTVEAPVAAENGSTLTVPITVAEDAPPTQRRLVVTRADGSGYPTMPPVADRLYIALGAPLVQSISPLVLSPGDSAVSLTVRGQRLQDATSVDVHPAEDITVADTFSTSADGTQLIVNLSVAPTAEPGERVVTVTTRGGTSDATPSAANTLHVVLETEGQIDNLTSHSLGVLKLEDAQPQTRNYGLVSHPLGVISRATVQGLSPRTGIIGTAVDLVIEGSGLQAVDAVELAPPTGVAVSPPTVAADGKSVTVTLSIDENAPTTQREVRVFAGGNAIPASPAEANRFLVTPPAPRIDYVTPLHLLRGSPTAHLSLGGEHLQGASVRLLPSDGVTLGSVSVDAAGKSLSAQVAVAADAPVGKRIVEVVTAGGSTGTAASPANTVHVVAETGPTYAAMTAPLVGVTVKVDEPPPSVPIDLVGSSIGVVVEQPVAPGERSLLVVGESLGVAVGAIGTGVAPKAALPGQQLDLVISGHNLADVTAVELQPGTGIAVGAPVVAADGTSVRVSLTINDAAPPVPHRVVLQQAEVSVDFSPDASGQFRVGHGTPEIFSIEPILAGQGDSLELLVRGEKLFDASAVTFKPPAGITVGSTPRVNATGTELRVGIAIDADAPLESRVVRVRVPGAVSTDVAEPANTFTVYESVPE